MHFTSAFVVAAALSAVEAHMMMGSPKPLGASTLNNSPLAPDGSDYPCKLRPGAFEDEGAENVVQAGGSFDLSFIGSAVHGGGSCQVSVTTDNPPTKDSVFKVIHSIIGGCPATADGNIGNDPSGQGASTFKVTMPSELADLGEVILAWTWFNKIGNREMYMNCAKVKIAGGSGAKRARSLARRQDQSYLSSLPDMFKANIGGDCTTKPDQGHDVIFPNPGNFVTRPNVPGPAMPPECASGSGSAAPAPAPVADAPVAKNPAPVASTPSPQPTQVTPPVEEAPAPEPTTEAPKGYAPADDTDDGVFVEQPAPSAPLVSDAQTGPCSPEGAFVCLNNGQSFQQCGSGVWSPTMQMAAGTSCAISAGNMNVAALKHKRNLRFSVGHGHLRRRHSNF